MKILIPVDPEFPVPPKLYGGVERLVDGLVTGYTRAGHEVYLLANPESTAIDAKHIYKWKGLSSRGFFNIVKNTWKLFRVTHQVKPDIIHSFGRLLYTYPVLLSSKVPIVMTYGRFISPKTTSITSLIGGGKVFFTSAAGHMLSHLADISKFTVVYNFTDVNYFIPDSSVEKKHLMFLGRIEDIKGTKECIETALALNEKLIIAGNIQPGHDEYFNQYIKPHLENPLIEYIGPVDDEKKRYYLQRAKAFLFPIKWEEPFGIVMAEAMACGTPVVGFRRGSVPEVVKEGVTGFIVDDVSQMIDGVKKIDTLDREVVRVDCVERFSLEKITNDYLTLFSSILRK